MNNSTLDVQKFWERLTQISKSRNSTQVAFCSDLGFDLQQFRNKKSTGNFPTLEQLVKLADYFNVSLTYLITGKSEGDTENKMMELNNQYSQLLSKIDLYEDKLSKIQKIIDTPIQ